MRLPWGMAWRRDRGNLTGQRLFAHQEFQHAQALQGPEGFLPERKGEVPLHFRGLKRLPVSLVRELARPGKRGLRWAASRLEIPADVVGMQVRQEDRVDVLGTYPDGLQLVQQ